MQKPVAAVCDRCRDVETQPSTAVTDRRYSERRLLQSSAVRILPDGRPILGTIYHRQSEMDYWTKIKTVCTELSPDCRAAVRAQSEQLDHPLTWSQRLGLWLHLRLCRWCHRYGRQIRFLRTAAQAQAESPAADTGPQLTAAARERIRQRLQDAK